MTRPTKEQFINFAGDEPEERALFEAWRERAIWYTTSKAFAEDSDDGKSIHRMMNMAAYDAWQARAELTAKESP